MRGDSAIVWTGWCKIFAIRGYDSGFKTWLQFLPRVIEFEEEPGTLEVGYTGDAFQKQRLSF